MFSADNPNRFRVKQKGFRSKLLCRKCEGERNSRYEQPFRRIWMDRKKYKIMVNKKEHIIKGLDYKSFKLFHLSIVFLAHHCDSVPFAAVDIGDHVSRMREMLNAEDPGSFNEYPIACSAVDMQGGAISPEFVSVASVFYGYQPLVIMEFGGCRWYTFISRVLTPAIDKIAFKENGNLPIAKRPRFDGILK